MGAPAAGETAMSIAKSPDPSSVSRSASELTGQLWLFCPVMMTPRIGCRVTEQEHNRRDAPRRTERNLLILMVLAFDPFEPQAVDEAGWEKGDERG